MAEGHKIAAAHLRSMQKTAKEKICNIVSQMKRAGLSVSNNIAEGAARKNKPVKRQFFGIAPSSAGKLIIA